MSTSPKVEPNKIRVLVAKPGLDGHDRGAKVIARALRDAGFEVIYTGLHQTPEMVVNAAVEEDVHVVGLSILSGAHNALVPEIKEGLNKAGLTDCLFVLGGIIPDEDIPEMKKQGVDMVFTPGTSLTDVVEYIKKNAPVRA
ncbi:MAG: cobalamin B12-binding domain-containing protein [Methylotenera sp.]|nr:cobalamin B12-binding domain-containing protein [Oligoflexia bacterium]